MNPHHILGMWSSKILDFLELDLQAVVNHLKWAPGIKLKSFGRVINTLADEPSLQSGFP